MVVAEQRWLFSFLFLSFCLSPPFCFFTPVSLSFGFFFFFFCWSHPSVCLYFCFFFHFSRCRCCYRRLGGWWLWWLWQEAKVEREIEKGAASRNPEKRWFFLNFGPPILPPWNMKIKYIYRRWKRDILSLLVQNLNPWFDPKASQPLAQSRNDELLVLCRKMAGRVGHFRVMSPPLQPRSARTAYTSV